METGKTLLTPVYGTSIIMCIDHFYTLNHCLFFPTWKKTWENWV